MITVLLIAGAIFMVVLPFLVIASHILEFGFEGFFELIVEPIHRRMEKIFGENTPYGLSIALAALALYYIIRYVIPFLWPYFLKIL